VQVELDALDPDVLRGLFADAIDAHWDTSGSSPCLTGNGMLRVSNRRL
jgi:hypothetical protein